ncbi:MAG: hypothetical protein GY832_44725 [Chloroflexi bacterium]|nr:hypothetical protein [Chloroflexota bacterium]
MRLVSLPGRWKYAAGACLPASAGRRRQGAGEGDQISVCGKGSLLESACLLWQAGGSNLAALGLRVRLEQIGSVVVG